MNIDHYTISIPISEDLIHIIIIGTMETRDERGVNRIEYIGSKYKLIDWILPEIVPSGDSTVRIADLFGGTGIVSHTLSRVCTNVSEITTNDAEPYSYIVSRAMLNGVFNETCKKFIDNVNTLFDKPVTEEYPMPITTHYSPSGDAGRMFFTEENARRIDLVRHKIEEFKSSLTENDYMFLLGSLLYSADKVSNTASVYGAYLKQFKKRSQQPFILIPIHTNTVESKCKCTVFNNNVMEDSLLDTICDYDVVYLDPPYNSRQYSKNYFPLNVIVKGNISKEQIRGKTGIPDDCFISDFCKKGKALHTFEELFNKLTKRRVKKIVMSYNSESIVSKDDITRILMEAGMSDVRCLTKEYSRFKSSRIEGQAKTITEYLFVATA